ncbi:MAG TPA: M3 family oligoendopeptidase [Anaerolineales bacterium]|nr:M3 family oligoendopeptidase [Anaerolineales bacterium]
MTYSIPNLTDRSAHSWEEIHPLVDDLLARDPDPATIDRWLLDWSDLQAGLHELGARLRVASVRDTMDPAAEAALKSYLRDIYPNAQIARQELTRKLLAYADAHGDPPGLEVPLRGLRVDAALFREENLALQAAEQENSLAFNKIVGAQTVVWDGEEQTITRLAAGYERANRTERRQIWELVSARELADREAINRLWVEVLSLRMDQAANAGFPDDYRSYRWKLLKRFDYTPEDSKTFQAAIEAVAVPAAGRVYARRRDRLGVKSLRPWDLDLYQQTYPVNPGSIRAFADEAELLERARVVFARVDPRIGGYFDRMCEAGMIDFANRIGKGPGAFCTSFEASRTPFIFGNVVGKADDVRTLLHEAGHAFHAFETYNLPYYHQRWPPMEFNEVASTAMELLAAPYLTVEQGGFFSPAEAARSRIGHLEKLLLFWPYMAVVDAFQHWVYENPGWAARPANCDAAWAERWDRFIPWIDWSGMEDAKTLGWHRKRHIHRSPFYYIEYGLAQLGAVQIWARALEDQSAAVGDYLKGLSLGGTAALPELYAAAGGRFAFDRETLGEAVALIETSIRHLEEEDSQETF